MLAIASAAVALGLIDRLRAALRLAPWQLDEIALVGAALVGATVLIRRRPSQAALSGSDVPDPCGTPLAAVSDEALMRDLRAAIAADALDVHYQPKVDARTSRPVSLEALARWTHPQLGAVSPGRFVPLAEASGDIRALTMHVLHRACRDAAYFDAGGFDRTIYVNISALLVSDPAFTGHVIETVLASGARIGIEITETAVIDAPERALANLHRIAEAGLPIAIDDYGVGLSSLTYLRQMPASELKIDMSFIRDLTDSHRDPLIVRSTVDLAHGLGMKVTAEGVDKPETLALLRIMGCDYVQGYQIAPALSRDATLTFLRRDDATDHQLPEFAALLLRWRAQATPGSA